MVKKKKEILYVNIEKYLALWDSISDMQFEFLCQNHVLKIEHKLAEWSIWTKEDDNQGWSCWTLWTLR